jgi:DNA repair protein RadC
MSIERKIIMFTDLQDREEIDLIAKIIGKGKLTPASYKVSQKLISYFKEPCTEKINYKRLASSNSSELKKIDGLGKEMADFVENVLIFAKKLQSYKQNFPAVNCPEDVFDLLVSEMRYYQTEVFKVLLLDTKNSVIKIATVSTGILDASIVHPREIFHIAIQEMASSIILVHNHPSGNPTPSCHDIDITKTVIEAGKIMNIEVIDHIIIGDGKFISLKEKKII